MSAAWPLAARPRLPRPPDARSRRCPVRFGSRPVLQVPALRNAGIGYPTRFQAWHKRPLGPRIPFDLDLRCFSLCAETGTLLVSVRPGRAT